MYAWLHSCPACWRRPRSDVRRRTPVWGPYHRRCDFAMLNPCVYFVLSPFRCPCHSSVETIVQDGSSDSSATSYSRYRSPGAVSNCHSTDPSCEDPTSPLRVSQSRNHRRCQNRWYHPRMTWRTSHGGVYETSAYSVFSPLRGPSTCSDQLPLILAPQGGVPTTPCCGLGKGSAQAEYPQHGCFRQQLLESHLGGLVARKGS